MGLRLLLLLAMVSVADAHAYRRPPPPPPPPPHVVVVRYVRTGGGVLARADRASVVRFLTGSTWDGPNGRIRFVDPRAGQFSRPPEHVRSVMIREIETSRAGVMVTIDGAWFTLAACRQGTCLDSSRAAGGFGGATYGG
jgi:hypothetical protein